MYYTLHDPSVYFYILYIHFYMETRVVLYIYVSCLYDLFQILQLFFINLGNREYGIYYMVYSTWNSLLKNYDKECTFPHSVSEVF